MEAFCISMLKIAVMLSGLTTPTMNRCGDVQVVPAEQINEQVCPSGDCLIPVFYYPGGNIYVADDFDKTNLYHTSIFLRNLVHWLQYENGMYSSTSCKNISMLVFDASIIQANYLAHYSIDYKVPKGKELMERCEDYKSKNGKGL